jgi:hypothetical protein
MRNNKLFFLAALVPAIVLTGCTNDFSKAVTSLDDFLTVADASELTIQTSVVKLESGSSSPTDDKSSSSAASAASSSDSTDTETKPAHGAYLYANGNFQLTDGDSAYIGYSQSADTETDYFLIDSNKKTGFVTLDQSLLSNRLAQSKALITTDYSALAAVYADMKTYVGKKASDYPNMTSLSLSLSIAGDAAGYTLETLENISDTKVETRVLLTLDQVNGKWAFSNYSKRVTTTTTDSKTKKVTYDNNVTEYTMSVVAELPALSLNLSIYTIYLQDKGAGDVTWTDGTPLTKK